VDFQNGKLAQSSKQFRVELSGAGRGQEDDDFVNAIATLDLALRSIEQTSQYRCSK
jgi:hypothetical protein